MKGPFNDEEFISEPIVPDSATFDTARMSIGEPGLPGKFTWHKNAYSIKRVLSAWHKTSPCTHSSGEMYVRRHYYKILTESGERMTLYFDRQPRRNEAKGPRWWLLSIEREVH
ncbi:MAG: cytoplasmic protein [Candidatus Omnitrophica bacterium]|nr:cytoplasmic protein [Candidatus Omnitrophota bacterium]